MLSLQACKKGSVDNSTITEKPTDKDSIKNVVLETIKKEPKVKDAFITDANVLYVAVESDNTNRNGFAAYFCETLKELKSDVKTVKVVEYGTTQNKNRDNAYGVLLGESNCN